MIPESVLTSDGFLEDVNAWSGIHGMLMVRPDAPHVLQVSH